MPSEECIINGVNLIDNFFKVEFTLVSKQSKCTNELSLSPATEGENIGKFYGRITGLSDQPEESWQNLGTLENYFQGLYDIGLTA